MRRTRLVQTLVGAVLAGGVAGCEAPLFPADAPRTPYERYMTLRGRQRAAAEPGDLEGRPNLRERLRPLGEP